MAGNYTQRYIGVIRVYIILDDNSSNYQKIFTPNPKIENFSFGEQLLELLLMCAIEETRYIINRTILLL